MTNQRIAALEHENRRLRGLLQPFDFQLTKPLVDSQCLCDRLELSDVEAVSEFLHRPAQPISRSDHIGDVTKMVAAPQEAEPVALTYRNWRGEVAERTIIPRRVWFGSTDWHPASQWLLTAFDTEKGADRDFALKDFGQPAPAPALPVDAPCADRLPWAMHKSRELADDRTNVICPDADVVILANIEVCVANLIVIEHNAALRAQQVKALDEWHEGLGDCLWWCWRGGEWLGEAPYVGSPLDLGHTVECVTHSQNGETPAARFMVGGWPGYHTHFTPLPAQPAALSGEAQ